MSQVEREYVVPLGRAWIAAEYRRAEKVVQMIRRFVARHVKTKPELVKLDPSLNELIWSRGIRADWRRLKVKVVKEEETYRVLPS